MRLILAATIVMALLVPLCPAHADGDPDTLELADDLTVTVLQDGVYRITHAFPWPANSLLVEVTGSDLVLVDTPYTAEATAILFDWIDDTFDGYDIVAINTGFHVDNLGGNVYLVERGVPVYGSTLTVELLAERGEDARELTLSWLDPDSVYFAGHRDVEFVPPTITFDIDDGLILTYDDATVEVYYPGPTHTNDNVVVWFPERGLMFGGCMILAGEQVGNTADADMDAWPVSVARLKTFEIEMLIPGHGDRTDAGLLEHTLSLLK
jgi:metallo-beta-lactamase class B